MDTTTTTVHGTADSGDEIGVPRSRIVVASMIGTTIEFYDFYIYWSIGRFRFSVRQDLFPSRHSQSGMVCPLSVSTIRKAWGSPP